MKKTLYIITTFIIGSLFSGCSKQRPEEVDFMILYTSQMYGNFLPWDFDKDQEKNVSLANFKSLVKEQRAIYGDCLLVLDNGNLHTRNLSNLYSLYFDTINEPLSIRAQREIGYDAVSIGSSDLRVRELFECHRHDSATCPPTICTNLFDTRTGKQFFRPWVFFERKGIRVVVFSLVDEKGDRWTPRFAHPNAECRPMVETMRDQIMELRHLYNPDLVIGLVSSDRPNDLQNQIPGIDLLITNGDDADSRNHAGMVRINMKLDGRTDTYVKRRFSVSIDLQQYEADQEYVTSFADDIQAIRKVYNEEYGNIPDSIYTYLGLFSGHDYYREILHKAQFWSAPYADVSLTNLVNPTATIAPGPVNMSKISQLFNHENMMVSFQMSGTELKNALEGLYSMQYNTMHSPNDQFIAMLHDRKSHQRWKPNGRPYLNIPMSHFSSAAGVHYTVDLRQYPGNRISIKNFDNGRTYHPDSSYTVIANSYLASFLWTLPYLHWDKEEMQRRLMDTDMPNMRYVLYRYFKEAPDAFVPDNVENMDFIPQDWWRQSKERAIQELTPILE